MQIIYSILEEKRTDDSGNSYIAYGIEARENGRTLRHVSDITIHEKVAENFVSLCNRLALDPEQLNDAVYDLLCGAV